MIDGSMFATSLREKFLAFVFQNACFVCGQDLCRIGMNLSSGAAPQICDDCFESTTQRLADRCRLCSAVLSTPSPFAHRCAHCRDWNPRFASVVSLGNYSASLASIIVEIKRDFQDVKALQLGLLLGQQYDAMSGTAPIDGVVPVPSHWRRRWSRRGFQPSSVLADGVCKATGMTKLSNVLHCVKLAKKQSKLVANRRSTNVKNTFAVSRGSKLQNMRVLLVDDVMTTGATINECSRVLKSAGVATVSVAVAARGIGKTG